MFLTKSGLENLIDNKKLVIRPLLDRSQIGEVGIDLRLGYDFLVSIQGRRAFIDASHDGKDTPNSLFFQDTRRSLGDTFLLHPNQTILSTTLEYIKLPPDIMVQVSVRSSYAKLGLSLSTIVQPGYCGCISLELVNANKIPVNITVGAAIFQAQFVKLDNELNYFSKDRKYICQVRPQLSAINKDLELEKLSKIKINSIL
ncbi:MAG: dCTP deaminase [Bacteroidales bacterium]|jgi:dCTP deaminase|nr:dCTP deaminase [Bacteroidales bacterium]